MAPSIVGVDFAGPRAARQQKRKIVAIAAERVAPAHYQAKLAGFNQCWNRPAPGWTAADLAHALIVARGVIEVIGFDFPFSLPAALLRDPAFAALCAAEREFAGWGRFNRCVAKAVRVSCPVDLGAFANWKDKQFWIKRTTDVAASAQPPLKHQFQVLFNMTLLGNALLAALRNAGFGVVP